MKNLISPLFILVALVLQSCSPRVVTSRPNEADLSDYKTFAYLPNASIDDSKSKFDTDKVNGRIVQVLNKQMKEAGYTLDRTMPDLLVLISKNVETEVGVDKDPVYATYPYDRYNAVGTVSPYYNDYYYNDYANYGNVIGYETDLYKYKEGSLMVTLVDRESSEIVWRGATADEIYGSSTTSEMMDLVENIFTEYPLDSSARR